MGIVCSKFEDVLSLPVDRHCSYCGVQVKRMALEKHVKCFTCGMFHPCVSVAPRLDGLLRCWQCQAIMHKAFRHCELCRAFGNNHPLLKTAPNMFHRVELKKQTLATYNCMDRFCTFCARMIPSFGVLKPRNCTFSDCQKAVFFTTYVVENLDCTWRCPSCFMISKSVFKYCEFCGRHKQPSDVEFLKKRKMNFETPKTHRVLMYPVVFSSEDDNVLSAALDEFEKRDVSDGKDTAQGKGQEKEGEQNSNDGTDS
ncbi:unnamed protein product [Allacma fusca]|uniref:Uncharacterized protein n=1 Tax=Allacma fusca TaxID=39272 RepID=A0A8J2JN51_9HEXA|nr:unnamed protein product [Allacma fusca]